MADASFGKSQVYAKLIDERYGFYSLTTDLEKTPVQFDGTETIKYFDADPAEMIDYNRDDGFTNQDVGSRWKTWTMTQDKQVAFDIDAMTNNATMDLAFGTIIDNTYRLKVTPGIDKYRFTKLVEGAGTKNNDGAITTGEEAVAAIDRAEANALDANILLEGAILYVSSTFYTTLKSKAFNRFGSYSAMDVNRTITTFDVMKIVPVPADRLGANVNFVIVDPRAVFAVTKHETLRVFEPSVNQKKDAYQFQYRVFHDMFIFDNKKKGVIVSTNA